MHIHPLMAKYGIHKNVNAQARFRNSSPKVSSNNVRPKDHKYTGNVAADLAYASMYDNQIARDLKLMGLI